MHFTHCDWTRMSIMPTAAEVEHAKSQLKTSSLLILYGTMDIAEDIRQQLMTSSQRMAPRLIEKCVSFQQVTMPATSVLWPRNGVSLNKSYPTADPHRQQDDNNNNNDDDDRHEYLHDVPSQRTNQ